MPASHRPGGHSPPGAEGHGAGVRVLGWACRELQRSYPGIRGCHAEQRDLSKVGSEWRPWLGERPPSYMGFRESWVQPAGTARGIVSGVVSDLLRLWPWRGLSRGGHVGVDSQSSSSPGSGGAGRKQASWCRPRRRPGQRKWPGGGAFEVRPRQAGQMETRWRLG